MLLKDWKKIGNLNIGHIVKSSPIKQIEKKVSRVMHGKMYKKLPNFYYNILEDANYHQLNTKLVGKKVFSSKRPWVTGKNKFKKYKKLGGETWRIR